MKHVIESQQFDRKKIENLFKSADSFSSLKLKNLPLKGKIMASLFYEPSTRTRFSFESAMLRLGGEVISTDNAGEFSSAAKGETLEDSIRVINHYADVIVLRHPEKGASERASLVSDIPVINAGDGAGQHPTQALIDLYTIRKETRGIDGTHIAMVGDLKHGRTARSLSYMLGKFKNVFITFVSPKELMIGDDIKEYLERHKVKWQEIEDMREVLEKVDVLYQTRIQTERFKDSENLVKKINGRYNLTPKEAGEMKKGSTIMHPLPRMHEISPEVDIFPQAAYFRQAKYGLLVRMALLKLLLRK